MLNIVAARKNQPMHRLTILHPDLTLLDYDGNPFSKTLPDLVELLGKDISGTQSYSTIAATIKEKGAYARASLYKSSTPCIVVIVPLANEISIS